MEKTPVFETPECSELTKCFSYCIFTIAAGHRGWDLDRKACPKSVTGERSTEIPPVVDRDENMRYTICIATKPISLEAIRGNRTDERIECEDREVVREVKYMEWGNVPMIVSHHEQISFAM